jgi:hypothetical protein
MAKVRIGREEMESIVNVANRMAKRRHARFVIDHEKVEIVEEAKPEENSEQGSQEAHPIYS